MEASRLPEGSESKWKGSASGRARMPPLRLQEERLEAPMPSRTAGRFGPMTSSSSMKGEECRVVCRDGREYKIAISENRKMNFLGKAGRPARHEECQFEVCGHEFKEQPTSRAVCSPPASSSRSGAGLERPRG